MESVFRLLKCASLAIIAGFVCHLLLTVDRTVAQLPSQLDRQADQTRKELGDKIDSALYVATLTVNHQADITRNAAVAEIQSAHRDLLDQIVGTRMQVDTRVKDAITIANLHATRFGDQLDDTNQILLATAHPIASFAQQLNAAAPDFLDCDHNPNCVFNRYVGVAKGVESSSIALSKALPVLTLEAEQTGLHINRIAGSVDQFVTRVTAPQPWWKTVLGIARDAGAASRMFLP